MRTGNDFDELLRKRISEALGEPIEEGIDADDLMFDLGMRYLRQITTEKRMTESRKERQLSLWVKGCGVQTGPDRLWDAVTDQDSLDYIPPVDRITVFDLDGTLFCESDPTWFDFMLYKHRILEDPTYKERASARRGRSPRASVRHRHRRRAGRL